MNLLYNAVILIGIAFIWALVVYISFRGKLGKQKKIDKTMIFGGLLLFVVIMFAFLAAGTFYEYVESPEFCGTFCHVMEPYYESYEHPDNNPMMATHLNEHITCGNCHNGPGFKGTVDALIGAVYEVYSYVFSVYDPDNLGGHFSDDACLKCHDGTIASIAGEVVSYNDEIINPHEEQTHCSECHASHFNGLDGLTEHTCIVCHGQNIENFEEKLEDHAEKAGEDCLICHNREHPEDARIPFDLYPSLINTEFCASCHTEQTERFQKGIHNYVDCDTCHSEHGMLKVEFNNCDKCHNIPIWHNETLTHCAYCHNTTYIHAEQTHTPSPDDDDEIQYSDETCGVCHNGASAVLPGQVITTSGTKVNPHDDDLKCSICHEQHHVGFIGLNIDACLVCHGLEIQDFETKLIHHASRTGGDCWSCHDRDHPEDARIPFNLLSSLITPEFCSDCHEEAYNAFTKAKTTTYIQYYGDISCRDCHEEHRESQAPHITTKPYNDCIDCHSTYNQPESVHIRTGITYENITFITNDFCGSCHDSIFNLFNTAIHNNRRCSTCHTQHGTVQVDFDDCTACHEPPFWHDTSTDRCTDCHDKESIHPT